MSAELVLKDGRRWLAERQPGSGWYVVRGARPGLGDPVTVDGIRREIVVVARLPDGATGVHVIPDFHDPGCAECALAATPPTPEECRRRCGAHRPR